jgi:hypothetical protein
MLAFLAAAALVIIGIGWYLGWYSVQTTTGAKGNHDVNIEFNDDKIKADVKKGVQEGEKKAQAIAERNRQNRESSGTGNPLSPGQIESVPAPKGSGSPAFELPRFQIEPSPSR